MLPQFPLFPMDEGRENAPVARAHAVSNDGQWLLRAFNGWTWAREVGKPRPERTWVMPIELPRDLDVAKVPNTGSSVEQGVPDAKELALWFDMAREECSMWRAVWFYEGRLSNRSYTLFFGPSGEGILREAWNRDDISFTWAAQSQASAKRVLEGLFADFRSLAKEVFFEQLWQKLNDWHWSEGIDRSRPTYLNMEPEFIGGSESELRRLLRLFAFTDEVLGASREPIEFYVVPESAYVRARLQGVNATDVSVWHRHNWNANMTDEPQLKWGLGRTPWPGLARMETLVELALDENTPCGMWWEYSDDFAGRVSHTPDASMLEYKFDPSTMHERTEANLELRDWLASRVPEDELRRLLGE